MRHRWGLYSSKRIKKIAVSSSDAHDLTPVTVENIDVSVAVTGVTADVTCRVQYRNNEAYDADCVFLFALDRKSAMYRFEAATRGTVIVGQCMQKGEEDDARARRRVRFDESSAEMFSCGAGLLASGETVIVLFQYATELIVAEDGGAKFVFPTFVPHAYQKNFAATSSELFGVTTNIGCQLRGTISGTYLIDEIFCRELLQVQYIAGSRNQAKIALVEQHDIASDIKFTIMYKDMHLPHMHIESPFIMPGASDYYIMQRPVAAFTFYNRVRKALSSCSKGEYIIAIDRSGSMRGFKMQNARETLLYFLKSLPHGCYFNVVSFGSTFQPLFPRSRIYNQHNVRQALRLQMKMGADLLGTEILPMLKYIVEQPLIDQHMRQVFLLTDGAVSNTREVLDYMWEQSASGNTTRIFTFGIGESASRPLLLGLARAGNGRCQFLNSGERPYSKVLSALRNAMQPCLTDLDLRFTVPDGVEIHVMAPGLAGTLFAEESLTVYCLITGMPGDDGAIANCTATLVGKQEGQPHSTTVHFNLTEVLHNDTVPIHRLAIKATMLDMERGIHQALGAEDVLENEYEILVASQASNVASAMYTHFVGINRSTGQPVGIPDVVPVWPEESALHMSSSGVDLHFPETGSMYISRSRLSLPRTEAGLRSFVKSIFPSNTSTWSLQGQRQSQTVPVPAPGRPTLADIDEELAISQVDLNRSSTDDWNNFKAALLEPRGITQLQQHDGSWQLSRDVAYVLGTTEEGLRRSNPLRSGAVWITIICLVWLKTHFSSRSSEWADEEKRALRWLSSLAELEGYELSELKEMAESVVESACHLRTDRNEHLPASPAMSRSSSSSSNVGTGSFKSMHRRYPHPNIVTGLDSLDADSVNDDSLDNISNTYDGESLYRYEIFNLMEMHLSNSPSHLVRVKDPSGAAPESKEGSNGRPVAVVQASGRPPFGRPTSTAASSRGQYTAAAATAAAAAAAGTPPPRARLQPPAPTASAAAPAVTNTAASARPVPAAPGRAVPAAGGSAAVPQASAGGRRLEREPAATAAVRDHSTRSREGSERHSLSSSTFSYRSAQRHSVYSGDSGSYGSDAPSQRRPSPTEAAGSTGGSLADSSSPASTSPPRGGWKKKFSVLFERSGRLPKASSNGEPANAYAAPAVLLAGSGGGGSGAFSVVAAAPLPTSAAPLPSNGSRATTAAPAAGGEGRANSPAAYGNSRKSLSTRAPTVPAAVETLV